MFLSENTQSILTNQLINCDYYMLWRLITANTNYSNNRTTYYITQKVTHFACMFSFYFNSFSNSVTEAQTHVQHHMIGDTIKQCISRRSTKLNHKLFFFSEKV